MEGAEGAVGARLPTVSIWCCTSPAGHPKGPNGSAPSPVGASAGLIRLSGKHPLSPPVLSHLHHHSHPVHATPVADYPVGSGRHLHDAWMAVVAVVAT